MATLIFVILVSSFFLAAGMAFTKPRNQKDLVVAALCVGYAVGGLAMAAIYELHKIPGVAQ